MNLALYRVNENTRTRLKHPFGQLLVGSPEKTTQQLAGIITKEAPVQVIAVGDVVSQWMTRFGLRVSIYVIDQKTQRGKLDGIVNGLSETVVTNPAGQVTEEAYEALRKTLKEGKPRVIRVEGEEDLLTLPMVILAPIGSMIIYGQPQVGLVVVRVTPETKIEAEALLESMRISEPKKD